MSTSCPPTGPSTVSLQSLFAQPALLPSAPRVVQQLIESFDRDDVSTRTIAAQLEVDPVLSAKVLRLANSAYFSAPSRVETLDEALRRLGLAMVRGLALGAGMAGAFKYLHGMDMRQFWRHSLYTACTARWLARRTDRNMDLAFTVGLMQGLGQLLMHAVLKEDIRSLDRRCHPLASGRSTHEQVVLGYDHAEACAELARRWKFPASMVAALRHVAAPVRAGSPNDLAAIVHIAAWRATVEVLDMTDAAAAASCPSSVAVSLDLNLKWDESTHEAMLGDKTTAPEAMPKPSALSMGMEALFE